MAKTKAAPAAPKTIRLKHSDFYAIRPQIVAALAEIEGVVVP